MWSGLLDGGNFSLVVFLRVAGAPTAAAVVAAAVAAAAAAATLFVPRASAHRRSAGCVAGSPARPDVNVPTHSFSRPSISATAPAGATELAPGLG